MFDNELMSEDYEKIYSKIAFEFRRYENGERLEAEVNHYLRNDKAEYLPHILDAFKQFLNGIGYTYVEEIVATHESGGESSSAEVIF